MVLRALAPLALVAALSVAHAASAEQPSNRAGTEVTQEEASAEAPASPATSPAEEEAPRVVPKVDLRRIRKDGEHFTAPLVGSTGRATLTLDGWLQARAEKLLARARPTSGAAIVVEVRTGRVLAWAEIATKPGAVLLDGRAKSASVFKIITTAALLERARVSPKRRVCTLEATHSIERRHLDAPMAGASGVTCHPFHAALGFSRNAVYAQLATERLSRSELGEVATAFGFDAPARFASATLPFGELRLPAPDLLFARAAAGFTGSWLSPVGAMQLALTIANEGAAKDVTIVADAPGYVAPPLAPTLQTVLKRRTALNIARMMELTVHGGTSLSAFTAPNGASYLGRIRVAGKTGTLGRERGETTSWFVGFAPARSPEIAVTVLLENGHVWHEKANQVARDLLRVYFARKPHATVTDPFDDPAPSAKVAPKAASTTAARGTVNGPLAAVAHR